MSTPRLVPISSDHVPGIEQLLTDPDALRFTPIPDPPPAGFAREWFERYQAGEADGTRRMWAVLDEDETFLGLGVAPRIDTMTRTVELGYMILPEARGRGVATSVLRQLTDWALGEQGMLRIQLLISAGNHGSKGVAARCGYLYEGTMRSTHLKQDRRDDTDLWSLLPTDPRPNG
ncbi:GNAT family N-acetyltransferase [Nocardioides mesophilus]|uniref:GNAT family N-acetyltransferase n=1 Tax=Nocardioides mesophilus TaxID=433659 RepID=A0A7G9RF12_9ACTN|nr:GNAT family N-acetyltransferase [Nocardioides mesophilus]QNN54187.1 GNAT family N-acetyltransferase [Nocardioides mesophilus]